MLHEVYLIQTSLISSSIFQLNTRLDGLYFRSNPLRKMSKMEAPGIEPRVSQMVLRSAVHLANEVIRQI